MAEVGISDLHPALVPVLGHAALPDLVRPERAQAPRGECPYRRADGRRARLDRSHASVPPSCMTSARH
jgi:hypothetical protein